MANNASSSAPRPVDSTVPRGKRMRKADCTTDEWIRHRKYRKKLASAKWYAKKKGCEREALEALRQKLYDRACSTWCFTERMTPQQRIRWRCISSRLFHRWPLRPRAVTPYQWCLWMDETTSFEDPDWSLSTRRVFRQLCMREYVEAQPDSLSPSTFRPRMAGPLGHCFLYLSRLGWHRTLWPRCIALYERHPESFPVLLSFLQQNEASIPIALDPPEQHDRSHDHPGPRSDPEDHLEAFRPDHPLRFL